MRDDIGPGPEPIVFAFSRELFDLSRDPGETEDLAGSDPELLKKVRRAYALFTSDIIEINPAPTPSNSVDDQ